MPDTLYKVELTYEELATLAIVANRADEGLDIDGNDIGATVVSDDEEVALTLASEALFNAWAAAIKSIREDQ